MKTLICISGSRIASDVRDDNPRSDFVLGVESKLRSVLKDFKFTIDLVKVIRLNSRSHMVKFYISDTQDEDAIFKFLINFYSSELVEMYSRSYTKNCVDYYYLTKSNYNGRYGNETK